MRSQLLAEIARRGGVISRADAIEIAPSHVLDKAVAAGALDRPFARSFVLADRRTDPSIRRRAALVSVPGSYLSHTDALAVWTTLAPTPLDVPGSVHLSVPRDGAHPRRQAGLVIHRRDVAALAAAVDFRGIGRTVSHPQALVDSWPLLAPDLRRALVIDAVRERRIRTAAIRAILDPRPHVAGAVEIRQLLTQLDAGCQSELEIWGLTHVFEHPSLPPSTPQFVVRLPGRSVVLDRAYERERVGVELDGAAYHFQPAQRERDMRRDEALAAAGWQVLRFSWRRLHGDPADVRRRILAVLDARRAG